MKNKLLVCILFLLVQNTYSQEMDLADLQKLVNSNKSEIDSFFHTKNYKLVKEEISNCENLIYHQQKDQNNNYYAVKICSRENVVEFYNNDIKYINDLKSSLIQNNYQLVNIENEVKVQNNNLVKFYKNGSYEMYFVSSKNATSDLVLISMVKENVISDKIIEVKLSDDEINEAINKAKASFSQFDKAIKATGNNYKKFMLKRGFISEFGVEHIWLVDVRYNSDKNKFIAMVANDPIHAQEIKSGDFIEVDKNEISDWLFFDNDDFTYGGYTLQILRNRLSKEEKKQFDAENNLKFKQ